MNEQGNDEISIGPHDSNLLFTYRLNFDLDRREKAALVKSGIEHFASENVPLWHWYASIDGFERRMLSLYSIYKKADHLHANALTAMQLIEEQLPDTIPREHFLRAWFGEAASSPQKSAALAYLSVCGLREDLSTIEVELDKGNYQTRNASIHAIISINLREGREQAIQALYELQPDNVDKQLLIDIFKNDAAITENLLVEGTSHRCALVRRMTAGILAKRDKLPTSDAERLLSDSDEHVRYIAITALFKSGRAFSEEQAKAALVRQTGGILFGGTVGDKQLARFKQTSLARKTDVELESLSAGASVFDRSARLTLLKRHFATRHDELVQLIENRFKDDFDKSLADMTARYGEENQLVKETKELEEFVRKRFTREALDIICSVGTAEHLGLVRRTIKSDFVDYSPLDVDFLKKHGEWHDVPLIIAATEKSRDGGYFLSPDHQVGYRAAAKALCAIGKDRLAQLLEREMPKQLLAHLIVEATDRSYRRLSNQKMIKLLFDNDDAVRKACALKAARAFTKKRLTQILADYMQSADQWYYNVIHWLDLGISAPNDIARRAATKTAAKQWPNNSLVLD